MNRVKFTNRLRNLVLETGESQTSVANYFGVTTDYLLGVSDDRG